MKSPLLLKFAIVFSLISFLVCGLTYQLIKKRLGLSPRGNRALFSFLMFSAVMMIVGPILYRVYSVSADSGADLLFQWAQFSLLGWVGSCFLVFLFMEILQLGSKTFDPKKRIFLTEGVARTLLAGTTLSSLAGLVEAKAGPSITPVEIRLETLPPAFHGLTIAQISDVHVGPLIHENYLNQVVDQVMSLNADLIFITGDLVDGTVDQLKEQVSPLKRLRAKEGVYFCTGNHEYYSGAKEWITHLESIGIHVFQNSHLILKRTTATGVDSLLIAGVHDHHADRYEASHRSDPRKAAETTDPVNCKILLAHNPFSIEGAVDAGFHLQLSGHTHAGQFYPYSFIVKAALKYSEGLYRVNSQTQLYVNRGTGYWGPPNRLGKRSEVTKITLLSAALT